MDLQQIVPMACCSEPFPLFYTTDEYREKKEGPKLRKKLGQFTAHLWGTEVEV